MTGPISGVQRFFAWLLPKRAADMEAASRMWMVQCPNCGFEKSVWEWGGVRYKAAGNPRWYRRCPNCNKGGWHRVYKRKPETTTD
jgi:ssDNA-binding Zn-finger/Zn-ribbon topoisomerase 1